MSGKPKPAIVLVHGLWGGAAHWAKVIVELDKRGFDKIVAVENPLTSLADDVERTKKVIEVADDEVVLVGHSYGGAVITEAGNLPVVQSLVYVAAFAPDYGESLAKLSEPPSAAFVDGNIGTGSDGYLWIQQDKFRESFCQDVSADEALVMAVTQKTPLAATLTDTLTSKPAWRHVPVWYQVSTQDRMIHADAARRMAERINPVKTVELDASHASPVSQPAAVADLIETAANAPR